MIEKPSWNIQSQNEFVVTNAQDCKNKTPILEPTQPQKD